MTFFPLINILFLVILYFVHRRIFYITTILEIVLYVGGSYAIYSEFSRAENQFLWMLALTGAGFIMALISFFVAISLNHKDLYENHSS
jgi:hypothetical protein